MPAMTASPPPPITPKVRPSWWWFVLGGGLLVAAVISGIGLFVWTLSGFMSTDVTLDADGTSHAVEVGTDGDRMLWFDERYDDPTCRIVDTATGDPVAGLRSPTGDFRRSTGGEEWVGAALFEPGSGRLDVTCTGSGTVPVQVEIGPAPSLGSFGLGLVLTIAVPLVLGGLGLVVLLVTGILWSTRATTRR
ncbi:hypothetical protein SAMN05421872_103214 [Nocardioides lianchengensis]|uniref:Uncharacterized protein n=2 Tax=Nocardioides lianchengensis TaxID=1045774 RepID=A0A1G6NCM8_9ACTN|nr:hypothetical protein SAMN05421872_103214 [Nocardioides lianchengensis]